MQKIECESSSCVPVNSKKAHHSTPLSCSKGPAEGDKCRCCSCWPQENGPLRQLSCAWQGREVASLFGLSGELSALVRPLESTTDAQSPRTGDLLLLRQVPGRYCASRPPLRKPSPSLELTGNRSQLAHWPVHKPLCAAARAQQVKREELTASNPSGRAMFQELNAYIQLAISEIQQAFVYALKLGHPDSLHTTHAPYIRFVYDPAGKTLRQKFTLGEGSQGDVLPTEDIIDRLLETNPHTLSRAQLQQSFNQSWLKERTKVARPSAFRHPFGAMFQVVLKSDVLKWGVGHPHAPVTASAVHPFNIDMSEEKTIMAQPPKAPTEWMKMLRYTNVLPSPPERPELDILYGCIASGNADTFKSYYTTHRKRQLASTAPMQPGVDGSLIRAQMEIVVLYIEKSKLSSAPSRSVSALTFFYSQSSPLSPRGRTPPVARRFLSVRRRPSALNLPRRRCSLSPVVARPSRLTSPSPSAVSCSPSSTSRPIQIWQLCRRRSSTLIQDSPRCFCYSVCLAPS